MPNALSIESPSSPTPLESTPFCETSQPWEVELRLSRRLVGQKCSEVSERRGFELERSRTERDDARVLAAARVSELRRVSFDELCSHADSDPQQVEQIAGASGWPYRRRTSIKRLSRGGEELRILVQVDNGTRLGRLNPLAEEVILATPDGEMVGEYTIASEGDAPRRYGWPHPRS
jgi:hypothetical protein